MPAGTYHIDAWAPAAANVNIHRAHLYNISDADIEILGPTLVADQNSSYNHAPVVGIFIITAEKIFELRHYAQTGKATTGLGQDTADGTIEIYSEVVIQQLAVG